MEAHRLAVQARLDAVLQDELFEGHYLAERAGGALLLQLRQAA
jgi:hypothetical protein